MYFYFSSISASSAFDTFLLRRNTQSDNAEIG